MSAESEPRPGWVDQELAGEFPGLGIATLELEAADGPSSDGVRERLRRLSGRVRGADAVAMRQQPVPWAYRVFFRQIGLDPDATRTPVEAAVVERLVRGGFVPRGLLEDALTLAVVETGVPVWALDAERVEGPLGLRPARAGERLGEGERAPHLPAGRLIVADADAPVAILFGDLDPARMPRAATRRLLLFAIGVDGVPDIHVEEALWIASEALASGQVQR